MQSHITRNLAKKIESEPTDLGTTIQIKRCVSVSIAPISMQANILILYYRNLAAISRGEQVESVATDLGTAIPRSETKRCVSVRLFQLHIYIHAL